MRTVWVRDLGRCAFVSKDGRRCNERGFVEFHHVVPHGVGGPPTVANVQLRCKPHNAYEADLYYGPRATEGVVREPAVGYGVLGVRNSVRTELSRGTQPAETDEWRHQQRPTWGCYPESSQRIVAVSRSHAGPRPASNPA